MKKKTLSLTEAGKILYTFVSGIEASSQRVKELISSSTDYHLPIHFGTTLTIGEYTMPQILSNLLKHYPKFTLIWKSVIQQPYSINWKMEI